MSKKMTIEIFDTTLRDGAQSLPEQNQFSAGSKVPIADQIARVGVDTLEVGFPATEGDGEEVAEVAMTVGQSTYKVTPTSIEDSELVIGNERAFVPVITGLSLARPSDIETTWQAVQFAKRPGIHTFVASAEEHMRVKHKGMTVDEVIDTGVQAVRRARDVGGANTRVQFSLEAASTSGIDTLERFTRVMLQEDIDVINFPDTLGAASPIRTYRMFRSMASIVISEGRGQDIAIATHNHNDGERAAANSIAAVHGVIDAARTLDQPCPNMQIEVTSGHNLGERNGNANLAAVVRNLLTDRSEFDADIEVAIDTRQLKALAEYITTMAGLELDPNAAVTGSETNRHRAGVHTHAIVKGGAATYAAVNPVWFGHAEAAVVEPGKYQGSTGNANLGAIDVFRPSSPTRGRT